MKITNKMLEQYMQNKEAIKQLNDMNYSIEQAIKTNGGADTRNFTAVVQEREREYVVGRKEFEVKFGNNFLIKNDLLKTTTYQQVIIVEKKKIS